MHFTVDLNVFFLLERAGVYYRVGVYWRWAFVNFRQLFGWAFIGGGRLLETGLLLESIR